jgi:hypothetical protein
MTRAAEGDFAAFEAIDWSEDEGLLFWTCQKPYEAADGDPIPGPPR